MKLRNFSRSRKAREESRKIRGAELYDSIVVKSESDSDHNYKSDSKIKPKKSLLVKGDPELVQEEWKTGFYGILETESLTLIHTMVWTCENEHSKSTL